MMQQKRIYPKIIKGALYRYRSALSYLFLLLLFAAPFITLNGEQLVLLNVLERKFVFFGIIFWPQDFYLFVLALLSFIVFIVLFTMVFGRVFCGWICPQTIFLEMVYRKIENWIEGDHIKQQKLDNAPMSTKKFLKKAAKHGIFFGIAFLISNIFLAYIIGSAQLLRIITEPVHMHISGFIAIWIFAFVFYLVFSRVRELVCTVVCPYGRLQSVLLDDQSIVVAYDYQRGEPRGKLRRHEEKPLGDCIDCKLCVQVCPTGIDIRNGTQLECVNCTACIDACNMVMDKIDRPRQLIGFKSEAQIRDRTGFRLSRKIYVYGALLVGLIGLLTTLLIGRSEVETTILRASGTLYQLREPDSVSNLYTAEMVNKTSRPVGFSIVALKPYMRIQYVQKPDTIGYGGSTKATFFVVMPTSEVKKYKTQIGFELRSDTTVLDRFKTTFIAPVND
ncbi:cytochrome c oxidase accessory protein CcoG [Pedobacter faecalis]|uniref:cytochrome c oxidase accessory protein CcoG n=1 Tax=Pedobacter faecalis TaxID=3041495 RepID=UPI00254A27BB|nr:cytochrome c oxidase accessory protein CcoG [Pedobacter sp. ELA7]